MGTLRSHDWVHSKNDQHFSQEQIKPTFMGTFSINPTFAHWAHWSHLLSVLPMYPACVWWVFGSLSPVPPTQAYLPPHRRQVRGTRSSPTSSTPSSTLGDVSSCKENSLPYSRRQRATPRNREQQLRMESQQMFWMLVKEYGMEVAQGGV